MNETWFLIANSHSAIIYSKKENQNYLEKIIQFFHPKDGYRFYSASRKSKEISKKESVDDHYLETFAKMLGYFLDKADYRQRFGKLVITSPPKFLGKLNKHISSKTSRKIVKSVSKNFCGVSKSNILDLIA